MDLFELDQILERKMYALLQSETKDEAKAPIPIENFVHQLASGTPVPGGGSAAAYAGAMGAALIAMVAHLTLGKKKYVDSEPQIQTILEEVQPLQNILLAAVEADSAAFEHVMAAYRLSKDTSEELAIRSEAIQTATVEAAQVPFETARKALRVIQLSIQIATMGNVNAITDAGTAAALAQAAIKGAGYNVRINCLGIKDKDFVEETLNELENIEGRASQFVTQMDGILKDRGGLPLS